MASQKNQRRERRHARIRAKVQGTAERPRLVVFRSLRHIYAQLVDDVSGHVMASSSSLKMKSGRSLALAKEAGLDLAKKAGAKKISRCIFDRGGYKYHGRVKAIAEGAREGGLQF